jgi:uncharacterized protein
VESFIYLHGFASSPRSSKAKFFCDRFQSLNLPLIIPDLNQNDFFHLTLTRQIQQVRQLFPSESMPTTLVGSSFGGLTSAWLAEQNQLVQRLILLAPAFQFLSHWLPKLGTAQLSQWRQEQRLLVYHYGEQQLSPLSYDFVVDAQQYDESQLQRAVPTLILHGVNDDVIPIQASRDYAAQRPWVKLIELDSDHALGNVTELIWQEICQFCHLPASPIR